jgi:NTP pyrophosphatase (non-canonical NTP hydrolase)
MNNALQALNAVIFERERQLKKWGEQNHPSYTWLAILSEEVGEMAQAMLHTEFGGYAKGKVKEEAIHVAAVALQLVECLIRVEEE